MIIVELANQFHLLIIGHFRYLSDFFDFVQVRVYGDCRNNIGGDCGIIPLFKAWKNTFGDGEEYVLYPCTDGTSDCGNYIPPIDGNQDGWMDSVFEMDIEDIEFDVAGAIIKISAHSESST